MWRSCSDAYKFASSGYNILMNYMPLFILMHASLEFSEVVVKIQAYGWREEVTLWASAVKLVLFRDAVLTQGLAHVQIYAIVFPGVA